VDLFGPNIISSSRLFGNVIRGSLAWGIYHQTAGGQLPQASSVLTQGGSQLSDDAIQISAIPGADCLGNQGLNLVFEVVHGPTDPARILSLIVVNQTYGIYCRPDSLG
jgi:hypothetical protein